MFRNLRFPVRVYILDLFGIDTGAVKRWEGPLNPTTADPIPANVSDLKEHK